jgi:AcrR family transcriptional regulator
MTTYDTPATTRREPKQERARHTRARLLHIAAELFGERGYANVGIQDIATRAEMTKGAVYFHFANKEELALAVVQAHYARWPEILGELSQRSLGPFDMLAATLDRVAEAFRDDVVIQAGARLQLERTMISEDLPQPYTGWEKNLTVLLERARDAGELQPSADPAATARILVAAFFGLQHISEVLTGRADMDNRFGDLRSVLLAHLRVPATAD